MTSLARATALTHAYGVPPLEATVLDELSVSIEAGDVTVLMGPSGSGKTTLVSILAGLLRPSAGRIELCGREITSMSDAHRTAVRRSAVGFVFQAFHLFPALSATDNVAEVLVLSGVRLSAARERARGLLAACGLATKVDALPGELSAGQRQRVAIARALAPCPRIVVADEPTVALDGATAESVMRLLREYVAPDTGLLLVTHDTRLLRAGDRVIEMRDGKIVRDWREATR